MKSGYGRVKVKFHWDRDEVKDGSNCCWVRVSQAWAGANFGAIHNPRIGQEVIVEFLEGDPDQPIITGRVYNNDNMPPYVLPTNQTQSGIKSRSTLDGTLQNFNEIRFEDEKGSEELFVQAEKTHTVLVKGSRSVSVGGTQSTTVTQKETRVYKAERDTQVLGSGTLYVEKLRMGNYAQGKFDTVSGGDDVLLVVGGDKKTSVDQQYKIKTKGGYAVFDNEETQVVLEGSTIPIQAPLKIEVVCGDTKLTLGRGHHQHKDHQV